MESIAYPYAPEPTRAHLTKMPKAEVRIDQAPDGRWMWAVSYYSASWGFGYHPLPKWGNFAADRACAIASGVTELLDRLRASRNNPVAPAVIDWLESLQAPLQPDLFAESA